MLAVTDVFGDRLDSKTDIALVRVQFKNVIKMVIGSDWMRSRKPEQRLDFLNLRLNI